MGRRRFPIVLLSGVITAIILCCIRAPRGAAQMLQQQVAPQITPRANATPQPAQPSTGTLNIPQAPIAPRSQLSAPPATPPPTPAPIPPPAMLEQAPPKLPAVFRGCWQGEVGLLDSIERLPGAHKLGYWTPKTYRLCYKRVGSGPFQLTFSETGVAPSSKIVNAHGRVDVLATDGRYYARLESHLQFDEYDVRPVTAGETFHVEETALLDCRINNGAMAVAASVDGTRDSAPWFRARWRALFRPVPDAR